MPTASPIHKARPIASGGRTEAPVGVLGAGPAGLTAAYLLAERGRPVVVFEATDAIGGLAQTAVRDGYRFDLGGHRFFTKSAEVEALWDELLGPELLVRPRVDPPDHAGGRRAVVDAGSTAPRVTSCRPG